MIAPLLAAVLPILTETLLPALVGKLRSRLPLDAQEATTIRKLIEAAGPAVVALLQQQGALSSEEVNALHKQASGVILTLEERLAKDRALVKLTRDGLIQ